MRRRVRITGVILWSIGLLAFCGLVAAGSTALFSDAFRIKQVDIRGNGFLTEPEVRTMLEPFKLENKIIWFADLDGVAKALAKNPRIVDAKCEREFPGRVILTIEEPVEFATLAFVSGRSVVVDKEGQFIRDLIAGSPPVGPIIGGFSEWVLSDNSDQDLGFKDDLEAWSGLSTKQEASGKIRKPLLSDPVTVTREKLRYAGAMRIARATSLNVKPEVSGYQYIAIDENFDLFLKYDGLPPIVMGGYTDGPKLVDDVARVLNYDGKATFLAYDYIDLHLAGYARGVKVEEHRTFAPREWSDGKEAVRVAAWETVGEVESRI